MDVLLSREPLDIGTIAYHNAPNNPIETRKLSHPPCSSRVDLTATAGREGPAGRAPGVRCRASWPAMPSMAGLTHGDGRPLPLIRRLEHGHDGAGIGDGFGVRAETAVVQGGSGDGR